MLFKPILCEKNIMIQLRIVLVHWDENWEDGNIPRCHGRKCYVMYVKMENEKPTNTFSYILWNNQPILHPTFCIILASEGEVKFAY